LHARSWSREPRRLQDDAAKVRTLERRIAISQHIVIDGSECTVWSIGQRVNRIPPGHPEGYLEAFATIYAEVAAAIVAGRTASLADPELTFPTIEDGFAGVAMVDAVLRSSAAP
jgi:hypothetical protein